MPSQPNFRWFHRCSAFIISTFLLLHLTNHIVGLIGQYQHIQFMTWARPFYRNAFVEPILLLLLLFQVGSGVFMAIRGWRKRSGVVPWLQAGSGLYMAAFLVNHVVSVLAGRTLLGLDTDFRFAAAGFHVPNWPFFFAPYYALAITALFTHIGCAVYWHMGASGNKAKSNTLIAFISFGAVLGVAIVAAMSGMLYSVNIPDAYISTYR